MSYLTLQAASSVLLSQINDHELEGIKLSSDINYYHMQESNQLTRISQKYAAENELIETNFSNETEGMDATSAEYLNKSQEKLRKQQESDNKQAQETQRIQRETDAKVNPLEMRKEQNEALIKNERAQYESMREGCLKDVEEECSYFN